jgi:predicted LPLAT superfamily acyltransferase
LFEIKKALENKEIIAFHGDRFIEGNKTVMIPFLGKPALFPLGPWQIAASFKKPVSFVFSIKETRKSYRFFATPIKMITKVNNHRNRDEMIVSSIKDYVYEFEKMVRKYPLQWYNYYDFWK